MLIHFFDLCGILSYVTTWRCKGEFSWMSTFQGGLNNELLMKESTFWTCSNVTHYVFVAGMSFSERNKSSLIHWRTKCPSAH